MIYTDFLEFFYLRRRTSFASLVGSEIKNRLRILDNERRRNTQRSFAFAVVLPERGTVG